MDFELVEKIKASPFYAELKAYLGSKVLELDTVYGLEKLSNEKAGEEIKARALAIKKLTEILAPFVSSREVKKIPTIEEVQAFKNKVGL